MVGSSRGERARLPDPPLPASTWVADVALAVALVLLLAPLTVETVWAGSWPRALQVAVIGALAAGHTAVALRRRLPRVAITIGGLLVLLLVSAPALDPGQGFPRFSAVLVPSVLVFPVLLYSVAAWASDRTSLLALAASSLGAVIVVARLWGADYLTVAQPGLATTDHPVRSWPLFLLLAMATTVLAPWLLGRHRRLRLLYVAELEHRARRERADRITATQHAAEHERQRIAREMHDVVAHSLAVMVNQAEGGRMVSEENPARAVTVLSTISSVGRDAMRDMRGILAVLHDDQAPPDGPQPTLDALPELFSTVRRAGLTVTVDRQGEPRPLCPTADLAAYRFVQEALTNVLKHAGPTLHAGVTLNWRTDVLELAVGNPVASPASKSHPGGRGLTGMAQRVEALGGTLAVASAEHEFRVVATIPSPAPGSGRSR